MTDNTEREAFERVCPLPNYLRWNDYYYENTLPDEKRTEESDRETDAFNSCHRGFQLGRAQDADRKDWVLVPREPKLEIEITTRISLSIERYNEFIRIENENKPCT